MKTNSMNPFRIVLYSFAFTTLLASGLLLAQDQPAGPPPPDAQQPDAQTQSAPANNGGWRRVDQAPPAAAPAPPVDAAPDGPPPAGPAPRATLDPNYSQGPVPYPSQGPGYPSQGPGYPSQGQRYPSQPYPPAANRGPIPPKLTIQPGTYITVRLNQGLSSDRNQAGDGFAATLVKPVVVDGVVVADRGQTIGGRVVEAKKHAISSPRAANSAVTAFRSLYGSTTVSAADAPVTPGVSGSPSVATPEPAATEQRVHVTVVAAGELHHGRPAGEAAGEPERRHRRLVPEFDQPDLLDRRPRDDLRRQLDLARGGGAERRAARGASDTAATTDGCACPRIIGPQEHTRSHVLTIVHVEQVGPGPPLNEPGHPAHRPERANR